MGNDRDSKEGLEKGRDVKNEVTEVDGGNGEDRGKELELRGKIIQSRKGIVVQ